MSEQTVNRRSQQELYGEPLADLVGGIARTLGLNQSGVARVLGLSTPMLSHLVAGRRVKIGNPLAHARLLQLRQLAADVGAGVVLPGSVPAEVERIAASQDSWATTEPTRRRVDPTSRLLAAASPEEWLSICGEIAHRHPRAAEALAGVVRSHPD